MSSPATIIQGTAVTPTQAFGVVSANDNSNRKETKCNDPCFVILFLIAAASIAGVAITFAPEALASVVTDGGDDADDAEASEFMGYIVVAGAIAALSFVGAGIGMAVLMCIPQLLIKISLIFSVVLAGAMAVVSILTGNILGSVLGLFFFAISVCYARAAWSRIPFATANLVTGITAIQSNMGVTLIAYIFTVLGVAWTIVWSLAFIGIAKSAQEGCPEGEVCAPNGGYTFLLLVALFFVQQVIQNSVHVTVAGTVATWWYTPQDCGCCSSAVINSFLRTITTSLGSICFGSLVVAIIQALKAMARHAREDREFALLACVAECILGCIQGIVEYFNKWAFVYVGVYGMNYMKAGKSVFELFRSRGWEAIIADDLVGNALLLISIVIGILMGVVGVAIEATFDQIGDGGNWIAFILGFVIGLVVTSILMSTIGSAVNAVIVLFAEGPREFEQNHPELSRTMRDVWASTYPGSI